MIQLKLKSLLILAFIAGSFPAFAQDLTRYPDDSLRYTSVFEVHLQGAYKGVIPLRLSVALDQSFTQEQKTILRKALEIYMKRGIDDSIVECTYNNSVKDLPASRERFESQVVEAQRLLSTEGIQSPSLAFISRYWDDPTSVGIGYMN
ncbi:MAG: hypothetical protein CMP10_06945, partial [Zetaproteobacteria bacterium]|nr:hypothetical protein [Pseudobdellovibrionaceae bacterium]